MNFRKTKILFAALVIFTVVPQPVAADSPTLQVQELLVFFDRMRTELSAAETDEEKQKVLRRARKKVLEMIDMEEVGELSMGDHFKKMDEEQKAKFFQLFHKLMAHKIVETNIPTGSLSAIDRPVEIVGQRRKRDPRFKRQATIIETKLYADEVVFEINFYLTKKKRAYYLYDITLDGASLLLDYQKQFDEIIRKKGMDYLLEKLEKRYNELYPENGSSRLTPLH